MRTLPFRINRHTSAPLYEQVVNGFTAAVRNGYLKPGERLPSIDGLAEELSVGTQTVRKALRTLSEQGDLVVRPRQGIMVGDRRQAWFTRHVVHLRFGGAGYYFNAKHQRMETALLEERVRVTGVRICEEEFQLGLPHLKLVLDSQPVDLILVDGPSGGLLDELRARSIPYVVTEEEPGETGAIAALTTSRETAHRALVDHLCTVGTERLCVVGSHYRHGSGVHALARAAGMSCRHLEQTDRARSVYGETPTEREGYRLVHGLLTQGVRLPDAFYFHDDYLARGGFLALLEAGLRVPEDVQVATLVNRGHCPFFPRIPTRIEIDPERDGEVTAALLLHLLRTGALAEEASLGATFIVGETTRSSKPACTTEDIP